MKLQFPGILCLAVFATSLLAGCSSSTSDTNDAGLLDDSTTQIPATSDPEGGTGSGTDTGNDAIADSGADTGTGTDTDSGSDSGTSSDPDAGTVSDTNTGIGTDPGDDGATDNQPGNTDGTTAETQADIPDATNTANPDKLVPVVEAGGDLDRLIRGVTRLASVTLLELNRKISEGVELSQNEEICLGSYDPAIDERLLMINCDTPLSTVINKEKYFFGTIAFHDTLDCHDSIFAGNTNDCILRRASLSLPTTWSVPATGPASLDYPGSEIAYAIDDTLLHVENAESALAGFFKCDIDLSSGSTSTPLTGKSCPDTIRSIADRLDEILPE